MSDVIMKLSESEKRTLSDLMYRMHVNQDANGTGRQSLVRELNGVVETMLANVHRRAFEAGDKSGFERGHSDGTKIQPQPEIKEVIVVQEVNGGVSFIHGVATDERHASDIIATAKALRGRQGHVGTDYLPLNVFLPEGA